MKGVEERQDRIEDRTKTKNKEKKEEKLDVKEGRSIRQSKENGAPKAESRPKLMLNKGAGELS